MNRTTSYMLSPDDPRLTAFALGELDADENAWVAAAVASRPDLQAVVDDIRRAAAEIVAALAAEPLPEVTPLTLTPTARTNGAHVHPAPFPAHSVATAVAAPPAATGAAPMRSVAASWSSHRRAKQPSYFTIMALAAACFAVVMLISERRYTAEEQAAAAHRAELAATERARAAAAAAQRQYVELKLSELPYAAVLLGGSKAAPSADSAPDSAYLPAEARPTSSFPIDVATTSYGDVVRAIAARQIPPVGTVRIEEMLNTFAYDYPSPPAGDAAPFAAALEAAEAPWAPTHRLVRIGLKGRVDEAGDAATIARNVAIVVEFNPASVRAYRLIGYEKSPIVAPDALSSGRVDAAEVRSGHTVTALYEVIPTDDAAIPADEAAAAGASTRLLTVRIAYTRPDGAAGRPLEFPLDDRGATFGDASGDFKFAAAVAGFGMILRQPNPHGSLTFGSIIAWAEQGAGQDATGRRREFVGLVRDASEVLR